MKIGWRPSINHLPAFFFFFFLVGFSSWRVIVFQSGKVKEVEWGTSINHLFIYFFFFFFFKLEGEETIQLATYHFSETFQPTIIHFLSSFFGLRFFFIWCYFFQLMKRKKVWVQINLMKKKGEMIDTIK